MKYIVPENRLEDLLRKSRERHSNNEEKGHKSGSFDLNGKTVNYSLFDKRNSIFSNTKIGGKSYRIFIMNELDFLPLSKEEQKKISEYRIKKYLEKRLSINESTIPSWLKRRFNKQNLENHISSAINIDPTPCENFGDEFEYADNVLSWALDDFLTADENIIDMIGDDYDDIHSLMVDYMKEWFGEEVLDLYRDTCQEYINESKINSFIEKFVKEKLDELEFRKTRDGFYFEKSGSDDIKYGIEGEKFGQKYDVLIGWRLLKDLTDLFGIDNETGVEFFKKELISRKLPIIRISSPDFSAMDDIIQNNNLVENINQSSKIEKMIESILSQIDNEYVCEFKIDPEIDEDRYWINIVFNGNFEKLPGHERLLVRTELANQIEDVLENYLSTKVYIGATVNPTC